MTGQANNQRPDDLSRAQSVASVNSLPIELDRLSAAGLVEGFEAGLSEGVSWRAQASETNCGWIGFSEDGGNLSGFLG